MGPLLTVFDLFLYLEQRHIPEAMVADAEDSGAELEDTGVLAGVELVCDDGVSFFAFR